MRLVSMGWRSRPRLWHPLSGVAVSSRGYAAGGFRGAGELSRSPSQNRSRFPSPKPSGPGERGEPGLSEGSGPGGIRTRTGLPHVVLSHARLPVPPPAHLYYIPPSLGFLAFWQPPRAFQCSNRRAASQGVQGAFAPLPGGCGGCPPAFSLGGHLAGAVSAAAWR